MQSVSAGTWTTRHQYQKRKRKGRDRHTKCLSVIHQTVLFQMNPSNDALTTATGFYERNKFRFFTEKDKDDDTRLIDVSFQ